MAKQNYNQTTCAPHQIFDYGKIPPQAIDLEESVLGAIMYESECLNEIINILTPEAFYKESHQKIYRAIVELNEKREPIDLMTVVNRLRINKDLDEVGGAYYVNSLVEKISTYSNAEFHARIIKDKYTGRQLIAISSTINQMAFDDSFDVSDIIDKSLLDIGKLTSIGQVSVSHISQNINEAITELYAINSGEKKLIGISSGLSNIDGITCGWQKQDLIIVAARPSMGKTALALEFAKNSPEPTLFFSLEMSNKQLSIRCISGEVGLSQMELRRGNIPMDNSLEVCLSNYEKSKLYISDKPALAVNELKSIAIKHKNKHGLGLIIVDYLQLMKSGQSKPVREQEIAIISGSLKQIAKELDIPVIALSQLNRSVESRGGNKRPMLSDLRESGTIEQDADVVIFIHRPAYYGQLQDEDGNSTYGIAEIIFAKHRNGACGTVKIYHNESLTSFRDDNYSGTFESKVKRQKDAAF